MLGSEGRSFRLGDITARRNRRARIRRQEVVVEVEENLTSDDDSDGVSSESDSESDNDSDDDEEQPAPPTPTSKTERVIPTLTAITHSPRPMPSKLPSLLTSTQLQIENPATRTTLSTVTTSTSRAEYTPPAVEAGIQASPTTDFPSATTGGKGLITSRPTQVADTDGNVISVSEGPSKGGLNAGEKAGIAVGVIAGVALLAALVFFLRKRFLSYLSRKEDQQSSSPRSPNAFNNANPRAPSSPPAFSANIDPQSNSQILDELIAASYVHQNGGSLPPNAATMPPTFMYDEKLRPSRNANDSGHPDEQPQIRFSIASWLRRHHPLKLNPLSARGSLFSTASKSPSRRGSGYTESPLNSQRNTMATNTTNSVYDYYSGKIDQIPPMPPAYSGGGGQSQSKAAQMAKYQSVWSESTTTSAGQDGRMMSGVPESVVTRSSGNESILWLYGRPVTNTGSTGSVYLDPLPVSPLSPTEGDGGRRFKRGSSPVLPPGYY